MDNPRSAKTTKIEKSERIIAYCPKKETPSLEVRIDRTIKGVSALMATEKIEARVLVLKFTHKYCFSVLKYLLIDCLWHLCHRESDCRYCGSDFWKRCLTCL